MTTRALVEAGDAVPEDLAGVEMELTRARMEVQRGESLRRQSVLALAGANGDTELDVRSQIGTVDMAIELPALESLSANLPAHPEMLQASAGLRASEARAEIANAERIPNLRLKALYHRLDGAREGKTRMTPA